MALYGYTVITGIIIWCEVACIRALAEIFVEGGASPKRPSNGEKAAKRPHHVKNKEDNVATWHPHGEKIAKRLSIITKKVPEMEKKSS